MKASLEQKLILLWHRRKLGLEDTYTALPQSLLFGPSRVQPLNSQRGYKLCIPGFLEVHQVPSELSCRTVLKSMAKQESNSAHEAHFHVSGTPLRLNMEISPLPRLQHLPPPSTPTTTSLVQLLLSSDLPTVSHVPSYFWSQSLKSIFHIFQDSHP